MTRPGDPLEPKDAAKPRRRHSDSFISRHAVLLMMVALFVVFAIPAAGVYRNQHHIESLAKENRKAIREIQRERRQRISTQEAINAYFCSSNNNQDGILAGLLAYSLAAAPPDSQLGPKQLEGKRIFQGALSELRHKTDCAALRIGVTPKPGT